MIELEEGFTENDRYLVDEYLKHGTDDFLLAGVGEATFVVPYKYRQAGKSEIDAIRLFKDDLLDFQRKEEQKYREAGLRVRSEEYNGERFVVPFNERDNMRISAQRLARYVEQTALRKYNAIIDAHRVLVQHGYRMGGTQFSMAAANKYINMADELAQSEREQELARVQQAAARAKGKRSKNFGISADEIADQIEHLAKKSKAALRRKKNTVGASLLIGLSVLGGSTLLNRGCSERAEQHGEDSVKIEAYHYAGHDSVYVDFMGREHPDSFGNIRRIMELKPAISAMIIALEGYAEQAYKDGVGQETIGGGTTFYLDDEGNEIPVQMGEKTTPGEAMQQDWRFIEIKLLKHLGDKLGRTCSDGDLLACVGFGFCIGERALGNSEFYKSVQNGRPLAEKSRRLTGFRQQKGVLKRAYILDACLRGICSAEGLLNMPIYKLADKGYLNCAPYRLDLHEIMPCKVDEHGRYIKDRAGNDVPVVASDGFCSYYNNFREIYGKMLDDADKSFEKVKMVRDFMPEDMILAINQNTEQYNSNGRVIALATERDYNKR